MPKSENGQAVAAILVHRAKPIFNLGQEIEESNHCMKFGRNQVINDTDEIPQLGKIHIEACISHIP